MAKFDHRAAAAATKPESPDAAPAESAAATKKAVPKMPRPVIAAASTAAKNPQVPKRRHLRFALTPGISALTERPWFRAFPAP